MIITRTLRSMLGAVESAERLAIRGLLDQTIETEPTLTDRLLGALEQSISSQGLELRGYRLRVRTLRDRGRNAPERQFGADLATVFELETPECSLRKGFLAQAKLAGTREVAAEANRYPIVTVRLSARGEERPSDLAPQCGQMLRISPASYVFVYSETGIAVLPANTIANIRADGSSHPVYSMRLRTFFRAFFQSFVGDYRLAAHDDESLRELRDQTLASSAMLLRLTPE